MARSGVILAAVLWVVLTIPALGQNFSRGNQARFNSPPPCYAVTPGPLRGAARGAAGGALIGAIGGNAGRGAAIGGAVGGVGGAIRRGSARSAGACL